MKKKAGETGEGGSVKTLEMSREETNTRFAPFGVALG